MPLRSVAPTATRRFFRGFQTSAVRCTEPSNHYETLGIPENASPGDIKKSFYSLSKTHHPDHNPNDPTAANRFVKISEAYAVLSHADRRLRYDRDVIGKGRSMGHTTPRGSYHSSGPAGGRPASGLSRRRTQFRGPPPSFYRSSGWGTHEAKRKAAADGDAEAAFRSAKARNEGGMGPGQQPFGHDREVPHFDREGHLRTHVNHERRRQTRLSKGFIDAGQGASTLANFFLIGGIITLGVLLPSWAFERMKRKTKTEV